MQLLKRRLSDLVKSVAAYYAKNNIRVNVITPALVETPMAQRAAGDEQILQFIQTKQPLDGGRIGKPEDANGLAVYFMSDLIEIHNRANRGCRWWLGTE